MQYQIPRSGFRFWTVSINTILYLQIFPRRVLFFQLHFELTDNIAFITFKGPREIVDKITV